MATVVPTVLAANPEEYATMFETAQALSKRIHVDIADGQFAQPQTIGLAQVHVDEETQLDLHLMMQDPAAQLETAISLKPNLVIFHAEASGDLAGAIAHVRELGIKAGVGLLPETAPTAAEELISKADHVLIFTGALGRNGGEFKTDQLQKINDIRALKPEIEISVDGGVSDANAALIQLQGVDVLYTGGFLQKAEDPKAAYDSIVKQLGEIQ